MERCLYSSVEGERHQFHACVAAAGYLILAQRAETIRKSKASFIKGNKIHKQTHAIISSFLIRHGRQITHRYQVSGFYCLWAEPGSQCEAKHNTCVLHQHISRCEMYLSYSLSLSETEHLFSHQPQLILCRTANVSYVGSRGMGCLS